MSMDDYSERQQAILRGEIPSEELDGRSFTQLIKRAEKLGDKATKSKALKLQAQARRGPSRWERPPTEYTALQKRIISGEVPRTEVSGRAAFWLYKKANELNDESVAAMAQEILPSMGKT